MQSALQGLISQAERFARKRGQPVTTGHLLLALSQRAPLGALLAEYGAPEAALLASVAARVEEHANLLGFTLERAEKLAAALRHGRASEQHLLLALLREPRSVAHQNLERAGARLPALRNALLTGLTAPPARSSELVAPSAQSARPTRERASGKRPSRRSAMAPGAQQRLATETEIRRAARRRGEGQEGGDPQPFVATSEPELPVPPPPPPPRVPRGISFASAPRLPVAAARFALDPDKFPLLNALGRNLCSAACEGQIDAVLGRDAEIERVLDVLSRRRANNPLLVGPSGVGKTAIAHGVALAIAGGRARGLESSVVLELSTAALVSGTQVRGALAERLQGLLQEVARSEGRVLVFIDEIHTLISAEDGADTLGGGLKAALARGGLPCIGATTESEYRRIFERDPALARRFTRVEIDEPTPAAALAILTGIAPEYARHHRVSYAPEALRAAVELSVRFMSERSLPDKAIALLDQAGARVRRRGGSSVSLQAVAEVVSEQAAVPLERLLMRDGEALLALEVHLTERVVGQDEAVAAIADAMRKSAAGFRAARPLGTFLLLGQTGVGKTEMAKAIAELLFPGTEPTRIDMSELSEAHTVARLLGAPPGYIGHEEGGQLTEPVRRRPYQLILLDEIEKAHRDVLLALLPLLDEGRLTDGRGRTVDFRNTVIVMTSNLGAGALQQRAKVGFGSEVPLTRGDAELGRERSLAAARAALPPELWNRIDEPLYFQPLDRPAIARIAERMVAKVAELVQREHGVRLTLDPSAIAALIAAGGFDPELGARPMRRTVSRLIEAPLARAILRGELARGSSVVARGNGDRIVLARTPENRLAAE